MRRITSLLVIVMVMLCNSRFAYATDVDVTGNTTALSDYDGTLYSNILMDTLTNLSDNALKQYKNNNVALIGKVSSVEQSGKYLQLQSTDGKMMVTCKTSDKEIKQQILGLKMSGNIVVCGKVTNTSRSKFEIKISYIYTIGGAVVQYKNGYMVSGKIYTGSAISNTNFNKLQYTVVNSWKKEEKTSLGAKNGVQYNLGDNETLCIYYYDYNRIKEYIEQSEKKTVWGMDSIESYIVKDSELGEFTGYKMNYEPDSIKIGDNKFDTYYGEHVNDGGLISSIHADFLFLKSGNDVYVIRYFYGKEGLHMEDVLLVLSSMQHLK